MKAEKILFITQEISPYVPESQLTKLGHDIPMLALDEDREIRTFMPKWGNINRRRNQLHEVIRLSGMNIIVDDTDHQLIINVSTILGTRMQVYFIDNEDFFGKRMAEMDKEGNEYDDNAERAAFYARGVLETVKKQHWVPDIVHCQGWMASLVPVYLKTAYADEPCFRDCRVVYTVTDNLLTKSTGDNFANILAYKDAGADCVKDFPASLTPDDLQKLAIKYSDAVTFATLESKPSIETYANKAEKSIMSNMKDVVPKEYLDFFDETWSKNRVIAVEED